MAESTHSWPGGFGSSFPEASLSSSPHPSWRARDAADALLARRGLRSTSRAGEDPETTSGLVLSRCYDVDTSLVRLRRDKSPIVQTALDAAASAVLENIFKADDDENDAADETGDEACRGLPSLLADVVALQEMRVASMERAHANKDLSKRKIAVAKEQEKERRLKQKREEQEHRHHHHHHHHHQQQLTKKEGGIGGETSTGIEAAPVPDPAVSSGAGATPSAVRSSEGNGDRPGGTKAGPSGPSGAAKTEAGPGVAPRKETNPSSSTTAGASPPRFTRNTPASSAAALEARLTGSRAVLCATANAAFGALTPPLPGWGPIDLSDVPQNPAAAAVTAAAGGGDAPKDDRKNAFVPSMDNVVAESRILGQRIENIATNAARRSRRRFRFRKDNVLFGGRDEAQAQPPTRTGYLNGERTPSQNDSGFRILENPFAWNDREEDEDDPFSNGGTRPMQVDDNASIVTADNLSSGGSGSNITEAWSKGCVPRLLSILQTGVGNAIIHDATWSTRHERIAYLLQTISSLPKADDASGGSDRSNRVDEYFGLHLIVTVDPDVDRFAKEFKTAKSHLRLMSTVDERSLRALPYRGTKAERRNLRKRFPQATGLPDAAFHVVIASYSDFLTDYIHFCQTPFEIVLMDDGASWMAAAQNDPNSPIGTVWNDALFSKNDHQMGLAGSFLRDWDYGKDKVDEEATKEAWIGLTARHRLMTSSKLRIENSRNSSDLLPVSGLLSFAVPHFAEAVREEWDRSRIGNDAASMGHFRKLLTRSLVVHDPSNDPETQSAFELATKCLRGELPEPVRYSDDPVVPKQISDEDFVADGKVASSRRSALQWLGSPEDSWLRYELGSVSLEAIVTATKASLNHGHICEEIATASSVTTGATGQIVGNLAFKLAVRCGKCFGSEQGLRQHLSTHHAPPGTWLCRTCKADCVTSQARTHHERSCGQASAGSGTKNETSVAAAAGSSKKDTGKKKGKAAKGGSSGAKEEKNADGSLRAPSATGLGGGVVPALSVINIKDLPPEVKPLLRDPRQTSRTGGNSKRHVYAYRGVCRQARKGHDRWQSQISFLGVNHYLGTFDSEWDAAAIYAWAHLILYGEEATKKAQQEGEEAAAAYEQEKKDIAAGKIPVPPPKPDKKSKQAPKRKADEKAGSKKGKKDSEEDPVASGKRKPGRPKKNPEDIPTKPPPAKRQKATAGKEDIAPILAKSVGKATILAPIPKFADMGDEELMKEAAVRIVAARSVNYCVTEVQLPAPIHVDFRPCVPRRTGLYHQMGCALLVGLDPHLFGWDIDSVLAKQYFGSDAERKNASRALAEEFGSDGLNQRFRCLVQGSTTVLGCAGSRTKRVYASLGLGSPPIGGPVGRIDCNTGGESRCCGETAACIRYVPTDTGDFQFSALSSDLITMNGQRITPEMGSFPLFNEDICTIGSRVFVFLLPSDA